MTREELRKRNFERIATVAAAKERRSDREWATMFGCSSTQVGWLRQQAGISSPVVARNAQIVVDLNLHQFTYAELSAKYGLCKESIKQVARASGIKRGHLNRPTHDTPSRVEQLRVIASKKSVREAQVNYIQMNPDRTYVQLAEVLGVSYRSFDRNSLRGSRCHSSQEKPFCKVLRNENENSN